MELITAVSSICTFFLLIMDIKDRRKQRKESEDSKPENND